MALSPAQRAELQQLRATQGPETKPTFGDSVSDFMQKHGRDAASTVGGVIGGIAALPAAIASAPSIIGPVAIEGAGVGLGAGIGGSGYDAVMNALKRKPAPTFRQQAINTAKDIGYNALSVPGGQVAAAVAKPIINLGGKALATALSLLPATGPSSVIEAAKAGAGSLRPSGVVPARAFRENLRGGPVDSVISDARNAVSALRTARSNQYVRDIKPTSNDPTVLNMGRIEQSVADVRGRGSYKGQDINKNAASAWAAIDDQIQTWKGLDPKQFHTPEGLDALKKSIGDISQGLAYGSPARNAADKVYNAIKNEIQAQAPDYAKVMRDYELASRQIRDLESSLSLGPKANTDTSLRKLQSIMRNNVNSAFGRRADLARVLEEAGASTLFPAMAGQALSAKLPRGLAGVAEGTAASLGTLGGLIDPNLLLLAPLASPRVVGEGAYYAGKAGAAVGAPAKAVADALRLKQVAAATALRASGNRNNQ